MGQTGSVSDLFAPALDQWGLRRDPFVWGEMANTFGTKKMPDTEYRSVERMEATFQKITGRELPERRTAITLLWRYRQAHRLLTLDLTASEAH